MADLNQLKQKYQPVLDVLFRAEMRKQHGVLEDDAETAALMNRLFVNMQEGGPSRVTWLTLVRHGETIWHAENRYAGSTDIPLSPRGQEQAEKLANWVSSVGPFVDRFEREVAAHVGVPHAVKGEAAWIFPRMPSRITAKARWAKTNGAVRLRAMIASEKRGDAVAERWRQADRSARASPLRAHRSAFAIDAQLVLEVDVAGRDEHVEMRPFGDPDRLDRALRVAVLAAREGRDRQLEVSLATALDLVARHKPGLPDFGEIRITYTPADRLILARGPQNRIRDQDGRQLSVSRSAR